MPVDHSLLLESYLCHGLKLLKKISEMLAQVIRLSMSRLPPLSMQAFNPQPAMTTTMQQLLMCCSYPFEQQKSQQALKIILHVIQQERSTTQRPP